MHFCVKLHFCTQVTRLQELEFFCKQRTQQFANCSLHSLNVPTYFCCSVFDVPTYFCCSVFNVPTYSCCSVFNVPTYFCCSAFNVPTYFCCSVLNVPTHLSCSRMVVAMPVSRRCSATTECSSSVLHHFVVHAHTHTHTHMHTHAHTHFTQNNYY
jgi:hypothetical protein